MSTAEIITIGTELLLGEIADTNTRYLARGLRGAGIDLFRTTTVGDNTNRIAQVIQEALDRSDIVITTGGLGPTVDDPTRLAIAQAVGSELEFHPELWQQIQERFRRYGRIPGENNRRQAFVPRGARVIENPVGTAPAFIYETGVKAVVCLPGVPREMEYLFENAVLPYLKAQFHLMGLIKTQVLHTASVGESNIDELIGDLELLSNPTVGLLAHPGQIDIRVAAKAKTEEEADRMIAEVTKDLRQRLGLIIYGADLQTLEGVTMAEAQIRGCRIALVEAGMNGEAVSRMIQAGLPPTAGEVIPGPVDASSLTQHAQALHEAQQANLTLGASLVPGAQKQDLHLVLITTSGTRGIQRSYGGPPLNAPYWAVTNSIDTIRRYFLEG